MRGISAQHGLKKGLFLAFALTAGLSLAACSSVDSLFGDDSEASADAFPPSAADAGAPPSAASSTPMPVTAGSAPVATITPVTIDGGADTGTAVNKTIQSIRNQVAGLQHAARVLETEPAAPLQQQAELGMAVRMVLAVQHRGEPHPRTAVLRPGPAPRAQHLPRIEFSQCDHQVLSEKAGQ